MVGYPGSAICGPLRSTWKHHPDRFGSLSRNSAIAKASQSSWGWIMNLSHLSSMDSPSGASALRTARRVSTYRLSWDARLPRRCSTRTNARRGRTSILPPKASALPLFAIAPAGFLGTSSALPVLVATCAIPPLMGLWKNEYTVSFGYAGHIRRHCLLHPCGVSMVHFLLQYPPCECLKYVGPGKENSTDAGLQVRWLFQAALR